MNKEIEEVAILLSKCNDQKKILAFLESWMTQSELCDMGKRWALLKLLSRGMTQRDIASTLGISLCKITRGSRELKKKDSAFTYFLCQYNDLAATSKSQFSSNEISSNNISSSKKS